MHLHVLPEAKMSSKTIVGNLLDYLVLKFSFLKRVCSALKGAEFTSAFTGKLLKTISLNCNCPQIKRTTSQLSCLRILLTFAWLCPTGSRMILMFGRGGGIVMFLCFMWKSLKHIQWHCILLTFVLWIYLLRPWSSCWEKKASRRKKLLNPHQNIWKIWWGGKEHKNSQCSFLVRRLSEIDLAN